jgi:catechol 2,3-dioxygenase-like lactoylglutathione lyase family enzyme
MGDRDARRELGTGPFDHMAFAGENLPHVRAQLEAHRVDFKERTVPVLGLHQVFFKDPNGIMIELNFPAPEPA